MTFRSMYHTTIWALLIGAWYVLQPTLCAQPATKKPPTHILLLNAGTSGLSKAQASFFLLSLQKNLSSFPGISISLKAELAKRLNNEDRDAFEKCQNVQCIQPFAGAAGFQRIILCKISKKNTEYGFQASEYGIDNMQRISTIADTADCTAVNDVDKFTWKIARKIVQRYAHDTSDPALTQSKSSVWWYIGSAVTVGVAAGIYILTLQPKENSSAPKSLPLPSDLP